MPSEDQIDEVARALIPALTRAAERWRELPHEWSGDDESDVDRIRREIGARVEGHEGD